MKKFAALLAVALMAAPTVSQAASMAGANTVNSAAIVDGSVSTADLANKAVTAAKIADSTITATQLANGAVTDAKITGPISVSKLPVGTTSTTVAAGNHTHVIGTSQLMDGAVTASKLAAGSVGMGALAAGSVTSGALADGSVTDAKITEITSSKIAGPISVDKVASYENVKIVHTGPADGVSTFNSINAAIAASADGVNTLIKVMPGYYTEDLSLTKSVTIEGSGQNFTSIKGTFTGNYGSSRPVIFKDMTINGTISNYAGVQLQNVAQYGGVNAVSSIQISDSWLYGGYVSAMMGLWLKNVEIEQGCAWSYTTRNEFNNVTVTPPRDGSCSAAIAIMNGYGNAASPIFFNNVRIASTSASDGVNISQGIYIKAINSELFGGTYGINMGSGANRVEMIGGKLSGGTSAIGGNAAAGITVVNAQVTDPTAPGSLGSARLVNCFDGNYNVIPNQ